MKRWSLKTPEYITIHKKIQLRLTPTFDGKLRIKDFLPSKLTSLQHSCSKSVPSTTICFKVAKGRKGAQRGAKGAQRGRKGGAKGVQRGCKGGAKGALLDCIPRFYCLHRRVE